MKEILENIDKIAKGDEDLFKIIGYIILLPVIVLYHLVKNASK